MFNSFHELIMVTQKAVSDGKHLHEIPNINEILQRNSIEVDNVLRVITGIMAISGYTNLELLLNDLRSGKAKIVTLGERGK